MEIRKLKMPRDLDALAAVTLSSFQYPENPEWSVQAEEVQEMNDFIRGVRRFWPLVRIAMLFSPAARHLLDGFICEDGGEAVGTLMCQRRQGSEVVYYISNVAVHPEQRRRGIARKLVETALAEMRSENASKVMLDVIAGNLPAYRLYEKLGWEHFSGSVHLMAEPSEMKTPAESTFEVVDLRLSDWQTAYQFAERVTPQNIRRFAPVEESRYKESAVLRLLEPLTGVRRARAALRISASGKVIGMCTYRYRTRPGGTNHANLMVDPAYSQAVPYFLGWLSNRLQQLAPGRKLELMTPSWQPDVISAAQDLGYTFRLEYHSMGLFLDQAHK